VTTSESSANRTNAWTGTDGYCGSVFVWPQDSIIPSVSLTEFSTTSICGVDEAGEDRTAAYGHSLVGNVVVGVIEVGSQLDHDRILHDLQSAAVTVASALSEESHILSIGVLDLTLLSAYAKALTSGYSAYRGNDISLCGRLNNRGEGRSIPCR
jgi:hypothetical protein